MVAALPFREIPDDPGSPQYRQGTTLGPGYRHWRRAKFFRRFRLFFRYHSARKIIIYVWLNDEMTLRKAGVRTEVYAVFNGMLTRGQPPDDFDALLGECQQLLGHPRTSQTNGRRAHYSRRLSPLRRSASSASSSIRCSRSFARPVARFAEMRAARVSARNSMASSRTGSEAARTAA